MASKQVVQIMIEAEENVSKAANKAESSLSKLGKIGAKAMDAITNVSSRVSNAFSKIGSYVERAREKFNSFKNSSDKLGMLKNTISNAANSFGQLVRSGDLAAKTMEKLKSVSDGISSKFTSLKSKITSFGSSVKTSLKSAFSLTGIKEKLSSIGGNIDKLKAKMKQLSAEAKGAGGGLGFLKNAASMAAGMIGYDLVSGFVEAGRNAINASTQLDYFTNRLGMSAQQTQQFKGEIADMQKEFRKVDMTSVGATAADLSARLDLPISKLGDVTRMTAVMSSEFVRNGSTQENAVLAVADAMDGQFRRLQEIGITQDTLMKNGWNGDLQDKAGLVDALNKSMENLGYDDIAKDITTLDEAFGALSVAGGQLLASILIPLTPIIIGIVDGILQFVDLLQNNALVQGVVIVTGLAVGFGLLAGAISVAMAAEGGLMTLMPGFIVSLYSAASGFMAISVAGAPLWAIVAVVAAVALAVYELGIAFGWWSDVGSMLEAISAGVQRLWDAFINHPDVQAALQAISDGLQWLWEMVQQAGQAVLDFFGITTGGNFDIVKTLIDGIGAAWNAVRPAIMFVIGVWQQLASTIELFRTGQMDLPTFIMSILTTLAGAYRTIFTTIIGLVVRFASQLLQRGISAAVNFVNGIINRIKQLPGKAYSALLQVVSRIVSAGSQWVSSAKQKASDVVNGVYNTLSGIPGKISSALAGVVSAITKPFEDAYNKVASKVDQIKDKVSEISGGVIALAGEESYGRASLLEANVSSTNSAVTVDHTLNVTLDLKNV
ncbi:MAG: hypothetical protein J6T69_02210, partial [Methanobrevibacter sp.]|nr:hypothetical protein [Methanobrevibacter sp.]